MNCTCMSCYHTFEGSISLDELGWHSVCPECGSSFDVDVPAGKIMMMFVDDEDETNFNDFYSNEPICSYYAFDSVKEFIEAWKKISENPDSMWYWVYVNDMRSENCICSGACDPGDIENFMEYFDCDQNGDPTPKGPLAISAMMAFKAEFEKVGTAVEYTRNPKYLYTTYNEKTKRIGCDGGNLVYQKRVGSLFYDCETDKPLIPQPPEYVEWMMMKKRPLAKKYIGG